MCDALDRVLNGVSKVVHGEDAPCCTLSVVLNVADSVKNGVAHVEVAACKVNLSSQCVLTVFKFAVFHALEKVEALFDRSVAVRRNCGNADVAAVCLKLFCVKFADVCKTFFDELYSDFVSLLEVVAAVEEAVVPVKAQPVDIFLDSIYVLCIFLFGVCVVHTQVAKTVVLLCTAEVDDKSLAVANVEIAVGFGRETSVDSLTLKASAGGDVLFDKCVNKVFCFAFAIYIFNYFSHMDLSFPLVFLLLSVTNNYINVNAVCQCVYFSSFPNYYIK